MHILRVVIIYIMYMLRAYRERPETAELLLLLLLRLGYSLATCLHGQLCAPHQPRPFIPGLTNPPTTILLGTTMTTPLPP